MKTINFNDIDIVAGTTLYYEDNNIVRQFDTFGIDNEEFAKMQFATAVSICHSGKDIERHMQLNGIDGVYEEYTI